jgi:RNA polymerase sigma-B factor
MSGRSPKKHSPSPADERRVRSRELVSRLADPDAADRDQLLEELVLLNVEVARSIARRYTGRSIFGPDLEQVACLALVKAARAFDFSRGHEFLAYAIPCMTGEVKRYFRDSAWVVRPPRDIQERHVAERGMTEHMEAGIHVESCFRPSSLDVPVYGDGAPLWSTLTDEGNGTWERTEMRLLLWQHLQALSPRARRVLYRRFVEDRTQQEIADELGVTQYHVSRLLARYLRQLRESMTEAA